jgi:hypothetical protein
LAECPFCAATIAEDLVTYGGPCPKCFAEIPGEDAPTDPGAEARAVQERRDRRGATIKAFLGLAAMAAMVSCTGVVALTVVLWPEPQVAVLDFDAAEFDYPEFELVGRDEAAPAVEEPAAPAPSKGKPKVPNAEAYAGNDAGLGPGVQAGQALDGTDAAADAGGPRGPRGSDAPVAGPSGTDGALAPTEPARGDIGLDINVQYERRAEVLSDPEQIRVMIGKLMAAQTGRLNYCYEQRLKTAPDLGGRWLIQFTVEKDGSVSGASATGRDRSDAEFEACLAKNIDEKWGFDRIIRAQPVQRTLTFRPG